MPARSVKRNFLQLSRARTRNILLVRARIGAENSAESARRRLADAFSKWNFKSRSFFLFPLPSARSLAQPRCALGQNDE
jgi:hypothetical protein